MKTQRRWLLAAASMLSLMVASACVKAAVYTNDTDWGGDDLTLQDGDVIAGIHTNIGHFAVALNAKVTVKPYDNGDFGRVTIYAGSADIQGTFSADGAGYPFEQGDGAGSGWAGAGHGGRGSVISTGTGGEMYGSPYTPDRLGSGGGNNTGETGGPGGGAVRMEIDGVLTIDGMLSANGGAATHSRSGGGSGGSLWLRADSIQGSGQVTADGGSGGSSAGGGGGGRIAFDTPDNQFDGMIRARGKYGPSARAGHGTFTFHDGETVDLVVEHDIALPPGTNWVFRSLTIPTNVTLDVHSILGTGTENYTNEVASRLFVLNDMTVEIGGTLSADRLGYPGLQGEGAGTGRSGASHGGRGGAGGSGGGRPGYGLYGSVDTPDRLGSGGATGSNHAGDGGGALILDVGGTLTVNGTLTAHGGPGGGRGGGGSGGSIWLKAAMIAGSGLIGADGGIGHDDGGGGGGGGRIAFDTPDNQFAGTVRARGQGGGGVDRGRNGTFNFVSDPERDLVIESDIALPAGTNWVFRSLLVSSGATLDLQCVPGDQPDYSDEIATRLVILSDVMIESNGFLSVDSEGYVRGTGEGRGLSGRSGAGYGGAGGAGTGGAGGDPYGLADTPTRLGSSGREHNHGGTGGGALILEVDGTLTVDGMLTVRGGDGNTRGGGGSGGSLWVKAATIAGNGRIGADGGTGDSDGGGGGGGGRIRLDYGWIGGFTRRPEQIQESLNPADLPGTLDFHGEVTVDGGEGSLPERRGEDGSRLFKHVPFPFKGTVISIH